MHFLFFIYAEKVTNVRGFPENWPGEKCPGEAFGEMSGGSVQVKCPGAICAHAHTRRTAVPSPALWAHANQHRNNSPFLHVNGYRLQMLEQDGKTLN